MNSSPGQVQFTEIMYDLDGPDSPNEFVELFNSSPNDSIDITGWQLRDRYSTDELYPFDSLHSPVIPPRRYALILESDYAPDSGLYQSLIPDSTVLLRVDDVSIGNGLSASDSLTLIDSTGTTLTETGWTDRVVDGYSLERIRIHRPDAVWNWTMSRDSLGTPGFINSVTPNEYDGLLLADSVSADPDTLEPDQMSTLRIPLVNNGLSPISPVIRIYTQENHILIKEISAGILNELDTAVAEVDVGPFSSGYRYLDLELLVENDQDKSNNQTQIMLGVRFPPETAVLNEFLPQPSGVQTEFVECVVPSDENISLLNWYLSDGRHTENYRLPDIEIHAVEGRYFVIADDVSLATTVPDSATFIVPENGLPSLNNDGDSIYLYDPFGTLIDSVFYQDTEWELAAGRSLEKRFVTDQSNLRENWDVCIDTNGMTPGFRNSITPWPIDGGLVDSLGVGLLTVPGPQDTLPVIVSVYNKGTQSIQSGQVEIRHRDNSVMSESPIPEISPGDMLQIYLNLPPQSPGEIPVTVNLEIDGDQDTTDNRFTDTLAVHYPWKSLQCNEFLPIPNDNQPGEFVEVVAFLEDTLKNWQIADRSGSISIIPEVPVNPGDYLVITDKPDFQSWIPATAPAHLLVVPDGMPSLNNTSDGFYLMDFTGTVIDSFVYDANWALSPGLSKEKLRPDFVSSLIDNWTDSNDDDGCTPGFWNASALADIDGAINVGILATSPQFPAPFQLFNLTFNIHNEGVQPLPAGQVTAEEGDREIGSVETPELAVGDSSTITLEITDGLGSGYHTLTLALFISGDEKWDNNQRSDIITVHFQPGDVLLNEFLVLTGSDSLFPNTHEFVEVYTDQIRDLQGWKIVDQSDVSGVIASNLNPVQGYVVFTGDSGFAAKLNEQNRTAIWVRDGFPSFNNDSDAIVLKDMTGETIDSLTYTEDWRMVEGRAMEKFRPTDASEDPLHWSIYVGEGYHSAGDTNSVYFEVLPDQGKITVTPNPFSPNGDGIDDRLSIHYSFPFAQVTLRIGIFDMAGRRIATPIWNRPVGQNGTIYWDGNRIDGSPARVGIYIIQVEARSAGKTWETVETCVLARKL